MGASTIYTYVITDNGDGGFLYAVEESEVTSTLSSIVMKEGFTYRLDMSGCSKVMAMSTTEDGAHGDDGEADLSGMSFYVDGELLEDIEEGDSAAVQWAAAQTAGEGAEGGWETSLYIDISPDDFTVGKMYFYDAGEAGVGGFFRRKLSGVASTVSSGPSYRASAGGEHHKAPPASRLAKKNAVRSAALQKGGALQALDENTSKGTKRGSNNSGHPPLAGGETVGGGSKGHSN